ncbi:hypothetical protein Bp8pS_097 [Bacillus phage vB_BpuM-BpSp]|nr:hypothetical protein Bp8pS_097 [Bacillus phage vB_BpuM-BpSp]
MKEIHSDLFKLQQYLLSVAKTHGKGDETKLSKDIYKAMDDIDKIREKLIENEEK